MPRSIFVPPGSCTSLNAVVPADPPGRKTATPVSLRDTSGIPKNLFQKAAKLEQWEILYWE